MVSKASTRCILLIASIGIFQFSLLSAPQYMADYTGQVFPPDHALNMPVDNLPVNPNSDNFLNTMGTSTALHPDFGTSWQDDAGVVYPMGIPYNVVGAGQPKVPISFVSYADESDPGPWPIPTNPFVEGVIDWKDTTPGDRHMLIVDSSGHMLYETGEVRGNAAGTAWQGACGAVFDLNGYKLRPADWTSADAAGLPIFPLLIRYDEVSRAMAAGGEIPHAIRFTVSKTQKSYLWPARHYASSSTNKDYPPMGLRVRMKASVDISGYSARMQVILRTFKKYGMIVADNGSNWFFQGTHDDRWDDNELNTLKKLHGSDFEVVDISPWINRPGFDANSAKVPPASGVIASPGAGSDGSYNKMQITQYRTGSLKFIKITYRLENDAFTSIAVFDFSGRRLRTLINRREPPGTHTLEWNEKDDFGRPLRSVLCIIRLTTHHGCLCQRLCMY